MGSLLGLPDVDIGAGIPRISILGRAKRKNRYKALITTVHWTGLYGYH